jgi:menaquinone-9 beta-reductase
MLDMGRACDVLVIGGGPAGLSASIACALRGLTVSVVDPARPPIDKACGEGILPDGLAVLRELGVKLERSALAPLRGIHFLSANDSETTCDVKATFANGAGAGVRRTVLHEALISRATELGVALGWGSRVEDLRRPTKDQADRPLTAVIDGEEREFGFAVIADGQHSIWRERLEFGDIDLRRQRYGFRRHYKVAPWSEFVEVYWRDGAQMYVTPVSGESVGIALLTSDQHADFDRELDGFPELKRRIDGAEVASKLRGAVSATRLVTHVTQRNIALIGDASGSVDAITGDGISIAAHHAVALAEAICKGDLRGYEMAHREIMRRPRRMGELLVALDAHPRFRAKALGAMTRHPEWFAKFLGMHTGAIAMHEFGVGNALRLGWELIHF